MDICICVCNFFFFFVYGCRECAVLQSSAHVGYKRVKTCYTLARANIEFAGHFIIYKMYYIYVYLYKAILFGILMFVRFSFYSPCDS